MKTLLLDVDGVLADFNSAYLELYNHYSGLSLTDEDVTDFKYDRCLPYYEEYGETMDEHMKAPGFASVLDPYPGSVEAVSHLSKYARIYYVTSPTHSETWCYDRTEWLMEKFGADRDQVIFARHKHLVRGDVLVDDNLSHIDGWTDANPRGNAVVWARPWNTRSSLLRTNDWSIVEMIVK